MYRIRQFKSWRTTQNYQTLFPQYHIIILNCLKILENIKLIVPHRHFSTSNDNINNAVNNDITVTPSSQAQSNDIYRYDNDLSISANAIDSHDMWQRARHGGVNSRLRARNQVRQRGTTALYFTNCYSLRL